MSQLVHDLYTPIQSEDPRPLSEQVADQIRSLIDRGTLKDGDRLPATRDLADRLGINRGVLLKAIRALQSEGALRARVGSGITVVANPHAASGRWEPPLSSAISRISEADGPALREEIVADFSRLAPDDRYFPYDRFAELLAETGRRNRELWQYADPHGLPELRAEIARRLAETGAPWTEENVLVTSGAQQGLDLLFKALVDPGDLVAVESPTYPGIVPLLRFYGARVAEIPVDGDRRDLSALAGRSVKLVYVMPERHNPTGVTMDAEERRRFLEAARATGAVVVEDGYDAPTSGLEALSAMEPERVATLGSFSKELVPGFRLGWIAADRRIVRALALAKQATDLQTPLPIQAAVRAFLAEGGDRDVRSRRAVETETRRRSLAAALARVLPEIPYLGGTPGQSLFWLKLPPGTSGRAAARRARENGVAVSPGADFDPLGRDVAALRLAVSRVPAEAILEGVARLARALGNRESRPVAVPSI
ncbi:MAG TPA: PLP-dependent aminotransferase family protein [Thermoanaerobaculia bacterium]|nr:PLP-dependent aminotransferase family protein [Thermoanaerobaculia bacterium]